MHVAFDTINRRMISADEVAKNNIDEPFRYECLCCGEEVRIAAVKSKKEVHISDICAEIATKTVNFI
jgi:hypothetical protein